MYIFYSIYKTTKYFNLHQRVYFNQLFYHIFICVKEGKMFSILKMNIYCVQVWKPLYCRNLIRVFREFTTRILTERINRAEGAKHLLA